MNCVFIREFVNNRIARITDTVTPGCEWVLAGEGTAYIKRDGTSCAVINGVLHRRYDAKRGKTPPPDAIPCDPAPDPITGHWPHWLPVTDESKDVWFNLAWLATGEAGCDMEDGTYELCGPHFQANPERLERDTFIKHDSEPVRIEWGRNTDVHTIFVALQLVLKCGTHEGLVFHHSDGRMAKIRRADFGFEWPIKEES